MSNIFDTLLERGYKEETIDQVLWTVQDHAKSPMTPSQIARKAGLGKMNIRTILEALEQERLIRGEGNGAWRRWGKR